MEETEEYEKRYHIPLLPSLIKDLFKEVLFRLVFNPSELKEGLLEFGKKGDKGTSSKNLTQFLPKNLRNLLQTREQILKDKRTFRIEYTEETSKIPQEFLKEDITATEKMLTAIFKDIGNVLNVLGVGSASESQREYSMAKSNYFYGKAGDDIEE